MSKKIIVISIIILLFALGASYILVFKSPINSTKKTSFDAITPETAIIIKLNKPIAVINQLQDNQMWEAVMGITSIEKVNSTIDSIANFIASNKQMAETLDQIPVFITFTPTGNNSYNSLLIIPLNIKSDFDNLIRILETYLKNNNFSMSKSKHQNATIRKFMNENNSEDLLFVAFYKGELLISKDEIPIIEAIDQINSKDKLGESFFNLAKTSSEQTEINLFINHKTIDDILSNFISTSLASKSKLLKNYAEWSEIDIKINDKTIALGGFTSVDESDSFFSQIITNQQPTTLTIPSLLPSSTHFFVSLNLSNIALFNKNHLEYLKSRGLMEQISNEYDSIKKTSSKDILMLLEEIFENETAIAYIPTNTDNLETESIWAIKTKSGSYSLERILEIQKAYIEKQKLTELDWKTTYKIDNQTHFDIYKFPYPNLPKLLFGELFSDANAQWVSVINNYLVFGETANVVAKTIHANILGQTLESNIDYKSFAANITDKCNYYIYCNLFDSRSLSNKVLKNGILPPTNEENDLQKFKNFAWQVSTTGRMLYNNAFIEFSDEIKTKTNTVWQSKILANVATQPLWVYNPADPMNKDILLSDKGNVLYLINNVGRILWQIQLEGQIMGQIHLLDVFKNGNVQFLFNTENKIYLIDRTGNNIPNFPINLRSKATNSVNVFDYENNKNYRYFIACADKNIYAYDEEGNLLDGWEIFKTDHEVLKPIQHLRVDGKDFIVASDEMKDYFLHRRGTIRIETNNVYKHSLNNIIYLEDRSKNNEPRFVTTDIDGNLHFTYLDGKQEVKKMSKRSEHHYFIVENINSSPEAEYIFSDSTTIQVMNQKLENIFTKTLESQISFRPEVYNITAKSKAIGLTTLNSNKIHLLDHLGENIKGMPLVGNSQFAVLRTEGAGFNIVVGNTDNYLYYYYLEQ